MNQRLSAAATDAAANAIVALLGASGFVDVYDGAQPATPDTAVTTQNKLSHHALSATGFGASSAGSAAANAIADATVLANGTASWARWTKSDGTAVFDCSVGAAGDNANLTLNSKAFQVGATAQITGYTFTVPVQGS